ncbi:MAG: TIGR03663 family protein, partial [Anaerolineae bacterium]
MTPDTAKSPTWLRFLFALILLLAVATRFYDLGTRVMSHDESLHTYFSWKLAIGEGYQHDPMMHGPFQFHAVALSYFLFGDSDTTARIPAALFSIASVAFLWAYRRYLGQAGTLVAAFLFVISPYMLYYGRYVRNEAFVAFWGLVTLWATLRYLENGEKRYLLILSAVTALHLATKETGFIYTAQLLIFLGLLFLARVFSKEWESTRQRTFFLLMLVAAALFFAITAGFMRLDTSLPVGNNTLAQPAVPGATPGDIRLSMQIPPFLTIGALLMGVVSLLLSLYFLLQGYGLERLRTERSLDLMVLLLTLILPQLAPLPVKLMHWPIPDQPGAVYGLGWTDVWHFAVFMVPLALIGIASGVWWLGERWWQSAAAFYLPFTLLYTTFFTNGGGFFSGMVGSLGYWLAQQGVQRGGQPWYYYLVVQIPLYEYLPFLASAVGVWYIVRRTGYGVQSTGYGVPGTTYFPLLAFYWSATSLLAYSVAGEKMPWLTVHIALPLILLGGWGLGKLIERIPAETWRRAETWQTLALALVFILSAFRAVGSLLGDAPPFHGKDLAALQATSNFIVALAAAGLSAWGLARLRGRVAAFHRVSAAAFFALLAAFTIHTAFQATYQNYDQANEYLVYAHSARGVKDVLARVEDLSLRLTDGLDIEVAYDDDTSWPMTWYLRHYRKQRFYGAQ